MSCITQLLKMKGDQEFLPVNPHCVIEGGGVYKGYEYLVTFTQFGTRCGYVAIPESHAGDNVELECHGGVTFSDTYHDAKQMLPVPCNDLWVGFDANHFQDAPDYDLTEKYFGKETAEMFKRPDFYKDPIFHISHKTYGFIECECKYMIDQLVESQA